MTRTSHQADTMRQVKSENVPVGRVHGVRLVDRGSCDVGSKTLTREEWLEQQEKHSAAVTP